VYAQIGPLGAPHDMLGWTFAYISRRRKAPMPPSLAMAAEPHPHPCTYCPVGRTTVGPRHGHASIRRFDARHGPCRRDAFKETTARRSRPRLASSGFGCVPAASSCISGHGGRRSSPSAACMQVSISCWRCTGLRFWREGRFAALGIGRAAQGGVVPPQGNFAPPRPHGGGSRSTHSVTTLVRGRRASARGLRG
jgi:hypothetical protein